MTPDQTRKDLTMTADIVNRDTKPENTFFSRALAIARKAFRFASIVITAASALAALLALIFDRPDDAWRSLGVFAFCVICDVSTAQSRTDQTGLLCLLVQQVTALLQGVTRILEILKAERRPGTWVVTLRIAPDVDVRQLRPGAAIGIGPDGLARPFVEERARTGAPS